MNLVSRRCSRQIPDDALSSKEWKRYNLLSSAETLQLINLKIANEYREIHDLNKEHFDFNEGLISPTSIFRQSGR